MGGTYWGCMRKKIWGEYLDQEEEVVGVWRKLHNEALYTKIPKYIQLLFD